MNYRKLLLLAILLHVVAFVYITQFITVDVFSYMHLYFHYGQLIDAGQVPYQDFVMEYPPMSALLFWLPAPFAHDLDAYRVGCLVENIAFDLLGIATALWAIKRFDLKVSPWGIVVAQPLWLIAAGRSILLERFDLAPAVLVLLAIVLFAARKYPLSWLVLGLSISMKLYPLVLVPLFLLFTWKQRTVRQFALDAGALISAIILPALIVVRGNLLALATFFHYHLERGLEIESLYASLLLVAHLFGYPVSRVFQFGSEEVVSSLSPLFTLLSTPLIGLTLIAIYTIAWRNLHSVTDVRARFASLVRLSTAAILAFMLVGKVLSPQYLLWLYPLVALLTDWQVTAWAMFGVALLLSRWLYPVHWDDLRSFQPNAIGVLAFRNFLLLVLGLMALAPRPIRSAIELIISRVVAPTDRQSTEVPLKLAVTTASSNNRQNMEVPQTQQPPLTR